MEIHILDTGLFKLDGGAMFGVVPKTIWQKVQPADERNLCTWAMRSLLVTTQDRVIVVDTGCGDKQSPSFFQYYYLHGEASLLGSLRAHGLEATDITDVILTHLHFDHVGGAVRMDRSGSLRCTFPKARYWSHSAHWKWACSPNTREKASFLKENFASIETESRLYFVDEGHDFDPNLIEFDFMRGHTESMIVPSFKTSKATYSFMADLIPSIHHIPLPYVMGYDVRPLESMQEKEHFLQKAAMENRILLFQHDPLVEACSVHSTERGIRPYESGALEIFK